MRTAALSLRLLRVSLLLFLVVPMFGEGAGTVITLEHDGAAVTNGEVCRFRAGDAENPFRRWLMFDDVMCVAAGTAMKFPAGLWNVFGRIDGKSLSAPVLIQGIAAPETLVLKLDAAATLLPQLPVGSRGLVYAPRRNSAVPIAEGAPKITVPADEELWLLVIDKPRSIASVVRVAALAPCSERAIDARVGGVQASVIGWLQTSETDRLALKHAHDVSSPHVRLSAAGPALDSDPLPPPTSLNGAFFLVRGVSAGEAQLHLEGRGWLPFTGRVKIADRAITIADQPLLARGASVLLVSWSSADDLPELDHSLGACDRNALEATQVVVSVSACAKPERPGEPVDPATCKVIREETFVPQIPYGSFAVDDVPPGHYRAEMRFGKLPPISTIVDAKPFQQKRVVVSAAYDTFYGSLTHGGEPLDEDATLAFAGNGVGFASSESGEYYAVVEHMSGGALDEDLRIDIATCDGRLRKFVLTDRPIRRNTRYDIDVPDNSLTVNVTDTFTRMPLREATLRYVVMSRMSRGPAVTSVLKSKGESQFVLESVPERQIHLTVKHPGYQEYRVVPFTMGKSEKKTIDVQLVPLRGSSGRIISSRPFESGMVLWLAPTGTETERAEIAPDGTFLYASSHASDETMAVVSLSHPLWIMRMPMMDRREALEVRFPHNAPARAFDISLKGSDRIGTYIGLVIGGVLVPQAALRAHQRLRDLPTEAHVNRSMPIRDIAETGPIDVLLGPTVNEVSGHGRSFDPLLVPQSAKAPPQRLTPGMTEVVFEVK